MVRVQDGNPSDVRELRTCRPTGNWPHVFAGYGNYGSVSFVDAFPLTEELDREILSRLGGRPRKLYVHI